MVKYSHAAGAFISITIIARNCGNYTKIYSLSCIIFYIIGAGENNMQEDLLKRINELAKKKRETGLTREEQEEQKALYAVYLKNFRESFDRQLDSVSVKMPDGKVIPFKEFNKRKD